MVFKPRRISDIKPLFGNLAQTSHYQVSFGGLPRDLVSYLGRRGVSPFFTAQDAGLLCYNASLPSTNFNSKSVDGNFTGIVENFAVARIYPEISLDFYVDSDYKQIKFMESWMEFIASGSHNPIGSPLNPVNQAEKNYFIRMQYPETYKSDFTRIIKFDRDYNQEIEYRFIGLWPISMSQPVISYTRSDILKITVNFKFDRYIAGRALSIDNFNGTDNNKKSNEPNALTAESTIPRRLVPVRSSSGVVYYDSNVDTKTSAESNRRFFDSLGRPVIN